MTAACMRRRCVGLAQAEDAGAVTALRVATYERAPEFRLLRPDLLAWDPASTLQTTLGGWNAEGRLVATMQGEPAADAATAARILGVSIELDADYFPSLLLTRAATAPGEGRSGLNSVLRWHFLDATIASGYRSCMGLGYTAAPRIKTMEAMGYRFHRPSEVWDPEVEPIAPPILCHLHGRDFAQARAVLESVAMAAIAAHPWTGPALRLPNAKEILP